MPFYELVFVTRQNLTPSEVDALTDKYKSVLEKQGGKMASKEYWGLRTLAYKIKKNIKGHYVLMNLDSPYPAVAELERIMGFDENLIRKAIFRMDEIPEKPSELMVSINAKDYKSGK